MSSNGVGPEWFPSCVTKRLTTFSLIFFNENCWKNHDESYTTGGSIFDKIKADLVFLKDMKTCLQNKSVGIRIVGYLVANLYFLFVSLFGFTAYKYM